MNIIGYLISLLGLYSLYQGDLVLGCVIFFVGGFLANKISISIRSSGVMILLVATAYGYHHEFSQSVFFILLIGFALACFNTKRTSGRSDWGFDFDFSSLGSDSDCGGSDGGGGD
jgi:hypothetical protein